MSTIAITREVQIALAIHTAGVTRSRRDYEAHPFAHCRNRDCHELSTERYCPHHAEQHREQADRERVRRAQKKDAA